MPQEITDYHITSPTEATKLFGHDGADVGYTTVGDVRGSVGKFTLSYRNGADVQPIAASTWTDVTRGTPLLGGTLGATDPGSGVIALVAPEAGTYLIHAWVGFYSGASGYVACGIAKNGGLLLDNGYRAVGNSIPVTSEAVSTRVLIAGDTVGVRVFSNVAGNVSQYNAGMEILRVR